MGVAFAQILGQHHPLACHTSWRLSDPEQCVITVTILIRGSDNLNLNPTKKNKAGTGKYFWIVPTL